MFLDRDGTIIEDAHHLSHVDQVRLIPGAGEAVRRLNEHGLPVVVVTNQSGVARGFFPESLVADVYARLRELLAEQGAHVDGHYHCPHHPTEGSGRYTRDCECRKPKPGMLLAAARELSLDLSRSWMVGDRLTDPQAGAAAGCRTVLVRTGHGRREEVPTDLTELRLEGLVDDLSEAVELILRG